MSAVEQYLAKLPAERRDAIAKVRDVINSNLPDGYEEKIQYGMISWCVPESVLPAKDVYNKQPLALASLASQKNHMAVYLMHVYGDPKLRSRFESAYKKTGKKLDMGQSCVRFKDVDALPLDVIGAAMREVSVDAYVAAYHRLRGAAKKTATSAKKPASPKRPAKPSKKTGRTTQSATRKLAKKPRATSKKRA